MKYLKSTHHRDTEDTEKKTVIFFKAFNIK